MRHNEKFNIIKSNIRKYRKQKNMTQNQLADAVGISISYLTKIEATNCVKSFSLEVLFDIADALNIDVIKFFQINEDEHM